MPGDADRVTVSTYVPAEQRARWREDAEALDMSQSEFVRAMVQAGRRGFTLDGDENPLETGVPDADPRGNGLKTAILEALQREGALSWSEIVEAVIGDVEDDVEAALLDLQDEGAIRHSPRRETYAVAGDLDGE